MKRSTLAAAASLAVVALVGFVVSPAFGGPGFLTSKQAKRTFLTKAAAKAFLTKAAADSAYLGKSEASGYATKSEADSYLRKTEAEGYLRKTEAGAYVTKAEADGKYLPATATTTLQVAPQAWVRSSGGGSVQYASNVAFLKGSGGPLVFFAGTTVPSTLQGRAVSVTGIELCYQASFLAVLEKVQLLVGETVVLEDTTHRQDGDCRSYDLGSPFPVGNGFVTVAVTATLSGGESILGKRIAVKLID